MIILETSYVFPPAVTVMASGSLTTVDGFVVGFAVVFFVVFWVVFCVVLTVVFFVVATVVTGMGFVPTLMTRVTG